jgi:prophage tail gpP-like protein
LADSFGFSFYNNPDNPEHKELLCIGHYHICTVTHNNETLLTGNMLSQGFVSSSDRKLVTISGYSLTGVLEDCEIPPKIYPLQSDNLSLKQIAQKIIAPFGLKMVVDSSVESLMNSSFKKSTAKENQNIKTYLSDLASQKNIVLSHTEKGELWFTKAKTKQKPIIDFDTTKGTLIGTEFTLQFDGQAMHSHITVQKQADSDGGNAGEETIRNPYVIGSVYRPKVISQSSGDDNDSSKAAKTALAAELKNIKLTIKTDRWIVDGKIIKPNNLITVINPEIYAFTKQTWFVESIDFTGDEKQTTAVLNCVLPEVYNMETPIYLYKGINLH